MKKLNHFQYREAIIDRQRSAKNHPQIFASNEKRWSQEEIEKLITKMNYLFEKGEDEQLKDLLRCI